MFPRQMRYPPGRASLISVPGLRFDVIVGYHFWPTKRAGLEAMDQPFPERPALFLGLVLVLKPPGFRELLARLRVTDSHPTSRSFIDNSATDFIGSLSRLNVSPCRFTGEPSGHYGYSAARRTRRPDGERHFALRRWRAGRAQEFVAEDCGNLHRVAKRGRQSIRGFPHSTISRSTQVTTRGKNMTNQKLARTPPRGSEIVVGMKNRRGLSIKPLASPCLSSC